MLTYEEINNPNKEIFWYIWEKLYNIIKKECLDNKDRYLKEDIIDYQMDEIIISLLLASNMWVKDIKEWSSLTQENSEFFKKVCVEIGHNINVLYSISKILNDIRKLF